MMNWQWKSSLLRLLRWPCQGESCKRCKCSPSIDGLQWMGYGKKGDWWQCRVVKEEERIWMKERREKSSIGHEGCEVYEREAVRDIIHTSLGWVSLTRVGGTGRGHQVITPAHYFQLKFQYYLVKCAYQQMQFHNVGIVIQIPTLF